MADKRLTRGKQKIEMKMIKNLEDRITTFSKRKSGIYKKANELATLCGAEVGFGTLSPSGKSFSFAHPSMESIENRLNNMENPPAMFDPNTFFDDHPLLRAHQQAKLQGLNQHYGELASSLDVEKEKSKAIEKLLENSAAKGATGKGWWETSVDDLDLEELLKMKESLEEINKKLCNHMNGEKDKATNNIAGGASGSSFDAAHGMANMFIGENPNLGKNLN